MEIIHGDAVKELRKIQSGICDVCVTSPPYYGLRDYGAEGQIGREEGPLEYVNKLIEVFGEIYRVLKDDGTLWINLGDSYATRSGSQPPGNTRNKCGHTEKYIPKGYKKKDLIGIPWMVAFALRDAGWYLRSDIIWHKPNGLPESVKDRPTKCYEHIFLLSKSEKYYYNAEAIKEPVAESTIKRMAQNIESQKGSSRQQGKTNGPMKAVGDGRLRNKRDIWTVATARGNGVHCAVFPEELIRPCILAGSRPGGVVIDPFCGSGTTGAVAIQEGREFIGIDINQDYCKMSNERIIKEGGKDGSIL